MSTEWRQRVEEYINIFQDEIVLAFQKLDPSVPSRSNEIPGCERKADLASPASSQHHSTKAPVSPSAPKTILEKAGVNISIRTLPPAAIKQMRTDHTSMPHSLIPNARHRLPHRIRL